jgi:selenide,water dikinase
VHPDRVWIKGGAQPGDILAISKPIGTGILLAGGGEDDKAHAIAHMRRLNRFAAEQLQALPEPPHAVTDVTGFGLLGHAWEIAERSGVAIELDGDAIPFYAGALETAEAGVRTGGDARNRDHLSGHVLSDAPPAVEALAFDPQTSGGLLAAVSPQLAGQLWEPIGRVVAGPAGVHLRWND